MSYKHIKHKRLHLNGVSLEPLQSQHPFLPPQGQQEPWLQHHRSWPAVGAFSREPHRTEHTPSNVASFMLVMFVPYVMWYVCYGRATYLLLSYFVSLPRQIHASAALPIYLFTVCLFWFTFWFLKRGSRSLGWPLSHHVMMMIVSPDPPASTSQGWAYRHAPLSTACSTVEGQLRLPVIYLLLIM